MRNPIAFIAAVGRADFRSGSSLSDVLSSLYYSRETHPSGSDSHGCLTLHFAKNVNERRAKSLKPTLPTAEYGNSNFVGLWGTTGLVGVLWILVIALTVLFSLSGCGRKEPPAVGVAPPKFTLPDLNGDKITLPDDFSGKVVVVRFWIDSCKSCEKEMPEIDQIYNKYKDKGLVVLAINVGQSRNAAEAFATRLHLSYPVLLDTNSATTDRYGVKAVPFTFVVDKKGVITKRILGETERESFEKMIQGLL